ncbi:hypothetical protein [Pseudochrobactrum sp. B5]|uniref:hypothetical protein n=1 Tax=Pseudochrobactrum sp. B5 TaxID=1289478 RepID=UPI0009531C91|nr:hypothetical protein [Pseudochrobactrum sp. B5]
MDPEVDSELVALQSMFEGTNMTLLALSLALLDAGVINKERLIEIIDSLHGILAAEFVGKFGDLSDAEIALNSLRGWLDGSEWKQGLVVEHLHKLEKSEFFRSQMRLVNSKHNQQRFQGDDE